MWLYQLFWIQRSQAKTNPVSVFNKSFELGKSFFFSLSKKWQRRKRTMATLWERLYESGQLGGGRGQKRDGGVPRSRLEHTGRAFPDRDLRLNLWELFLQSRAKKIVVFYFIYLLWFVNCL